MHPSLPFDTVTRMVIVRPFSSPYFQAPRHGSAVTNFSWRLLSAHGDGTILMWDLSSGRPDIVCSINSATSAGRITGLMVSQSLDVLVTSHK